MIGDNVGKKGFDDMSVMRRVILGIVFWLLSIPAFAVCPTTPSDCASPSYNNLTVKGNHVVAGTLGVAGTSQLGTGSANFVTVTGGASPTISAAGTGPNAQLILRGLGSGASGQVNIGGTLGGGAFQIQGAATNGGALQFVQPAAATSPFIFQQSTNTSGILWNQLQTKFQRSWTWAGLQTDVANRGFQIFNTISGTVQDPVVGAQAVIPINIINTFNGFNAGGIGARGMQIWSQIGTGTVGPTIGGLSVQVSQLGVPGFPSTWATSTSYSPVGALVIGTTGNLYRVEVAGTSASSGPGPTGGGSAIIDGSVIWSYQGNAAGVSAQIGLLAQSTVSKAAGGVAGAPVGDAWGSVIVSQAATGANFYLQSVPLEVDDYWNGGTINKIAALQLVRNGQQGTFSDWGLSIATQAGSPSAWKDALIFQSAVDPNGYGVLFEDQSVGTLQHMAGVFDAIMAVPDGTGLFGGDFYFRWINGKISKAGSVLQRFGSITPTSSGLTIDVTRQELQTLNVTAGGANWSVGEQWKGNDGSYGTVAAVTGTAISAGTASLTIVTPSQVTTPPSTVTISPATSNTSIIGPTGVSQWPTAATATPTYAPPTTPTISIGTASATAINIGWASSITTLTGAIKAGTSAGLSCSGTPTSSFATVNGIVTHC